MRTSTRILSIVALGSMPGYLLADGQLKDFTQTLLVGGGVLTKIIWAASIIVGIMLIAAAFTQFQIHRRNPKLVPLTTPVMYLILGIAAIAIPFIDRVQDVFGGNPPSSRKQPATNNSKPANAQQPARTYNPNDIDAPLN